MNTAAVCAGDVIFMMSWLIKGDMSCLNCSFLPSRMTEIPQFKSIKIKCLGNAHTTLANATYNGTIANDCSNWSKFEQPHTQHDCITHVQIPYSR